MSVIKSIRLEERLAYIDFFCSEGELDIDSSSTTWCLMRTSHRFTWRLNREKI